MTSAKEYGPLRGDAEVEALAQLVGQSFGVGVEPSRKWLAPSVAEARVIRGRGRVVGGLLLLPMGQFFGGRAVPMTGVAGVGVLPEERGQGTATRLMHAAVRELHQRGVALSALFPATFALYRRAGYEIAGGHYRIRVAARGIGVRERGLAVRPVERGDVRAVERIYRQQAAQRTGWLDRSPVLWSRVRHNIKGIPVHGYLVEGARGPEAYVLYRQEPVPGGPVYDLVLTDLASATGPAALRLLAFLGDHRSLARDVIWHGGVDDPFLALLPERGYQVSLVEPWMLRIVDVAAALGARGYPRSLDTRLELEVRDELLPGNSGRFRVDIAGGAAAVRRGGRGTMALDVRALAALYTGHATPLELAQAGRLRARGSALDRVTAAFAGPPPSLPDLF